jgi:hypothetical protein
MIRPAPAVFYGWMIMVGYSPFFVAFGIGLNGVKRDVLVALGMPAVQVAVVKGAVGFQNVVNPLLKAETKLPPLPSKSMLPMAYPACRSCEKALRRHAVGFKFLLISWTNPHTKLPGRHRQGVCGYR